MKYDVESFISGYLIGRMLPRSIESVYPTYLTSRSISPSMLNMYQTTKNWDSTLEYLTDTKTWGDVEISSNANNKLYSKGIGNN